MQGHDDPKSYIHARGMYGLLFVGGTAFKLMSNQEVMRLLNRLLHWGKESQ